MSELDRRGRYVNVPAQMGMHILRLLQEQFSQVISFLRLHAMVLNSRPGPERMVHECPMSAVAFIEWHEPQVPVHADAARYRFSQSMRRFEYVGNRTDLPSKSSAVGLSK